MKKYALQSDGMPVNRLSVATRKMEGHLLYLEFLDWFFPLQIGNLEWLSNQKFTRPGNRLKLFHGRLTWFHTDVNEELKVAFL